MKRPSIKTLINKNWQLLRKIVRLLRGDTCELCGSFNNLQIDHCFSRTCKQLFYDIRNLTILCSACHTAKSFGQKDVALQVFELVEGREKDGFLELRRIAKQKACFRTWQDRGYHEKMYADLSQKLNEIARGQDANC